MIVHEQGIDTLRTGGVLYTDPKDIRKLAMRLLIDAAECNVDMIMDYPAKYATKAEMESAFRGLTNQCLDMLDDHIDNLRQAMTQYLTNMKYHACLTHVEYHRVTGELVDVTIDITVPQQLAE